MKKYKTKKLDYTGCDPVILEHIQREEAVFCRDSKGTEGHVEYYTKKGLTSYYICDNGRVLHADAKPVPVQRRVKRASEIVKWMEDNGYVYTPAVGGHYTSTIGKNASYSVGYIHDVAGQTVVNGVADRVRDEWLEEATE